MSVPTAEVVASVIATIKNTDETRRSWTPDHLWRRTRHQ